MTDPLDLARRLREATYGMGKNGEPFDLTAAADLIESQHVENVRLRAIEKAALVIDARSWEWVNHSAECAKERAYEQGHPAEDGVTWDFDETIACDCGADTLRAALREKGAEE